MVNLPRKVDSNPGFQDACQEVVILSNSIPHTSHTSSAAVSQEFNQWAWPSIWIPRWFTQLHISLRPTFGLVASLHSGVHVPGEGIGSVPTRSGVTSVSAFHKASFATRRVLFREYPRSGLAPGVIGLF